MTDKFNKDDKEYKEITSERYKEFIDEQHGSTSPVCY